MISFCSYILLQQIAIHYRQIHTATIEMIEAKNNALVFYEMKQLETLWLKTDIDNYLTSEKMVDPKELGQARDCLNDELANVHREGEHLDSFILNYKHEVKKKLGIL